MRKLGKIIFASGEGYAYQSSRNLTECSVLARH